MSNYINSFDEKYTALNKMLNFKILNPPEVKYTPTFKINGVIHKIKLNLHGKGIICEQFTYNSTNNKLANLIHYHIMYDVKTLKLIHKYWRLKFPKKI